MKRFHNYKYGKALAATNIEEMIWGKIMREKRTPPQ